MKTLSKNKIILISSIALSVIMVGTAAIFAIIVNNKTSDNTKTPVAETTITPPATNNKPTNTNPPASQPDETTKEEAKDEEKTEDKTKDDTKTPTTPAKPITPTPTLTDAIRKDNLARVINAYHSYFALHSEELKDTNTVCKGKTSPNAKCQLDPYVTLTNNMTYSILRKNIGELMRPADLDRVTASNIIYDTGMFFVKLADGTYCVATYHDPNTCRVETKARFYQRAYSDTDIVRMNYAQQLLNAYKSYISNNSGTIPGLPADLAPYISFTGYTYTLAETPVSGQYERVYVGATKTNLGLYKGSQCRSSGYVTSTGYGALNGIPQLPQSTAAVLIQLDYGDGYIHCIDNAD